jgi:hypothetical protein
MEEGCNGSQVPQQTVALEKKTMKVKNKKGREVGRRKEEEEEEEYGDSRIRTGMAKLFDGGCKIFIETSSPLILVVTLVAYSEWISRGYGPTRCKK